MATKSIRKKANDLADQGLDAADDAVSSTRRAKNRANARYGSRADDAQGSFEHMAENVGQQLREGYESSREYLEEGAQTARRSVERNPLLAVAGAFVVGAIASSIFRR